MNRKLLCLTFLAAFMFTPLTVMAEGSERKGKGDREKRGGEQAQIRIDACAGIAEGDACTFVGRNDEEVAGTCAVARNEALLCRVEAKVVAKADVAVWVWVAIAVAKRKKMYKADLQLLATLQT